MNADGAGWFVDSSPWDSSEFLGFNSPASGLVDLLTVVVHELGHTLGFGHSLNTHDVMAATLPVGTRRLPGIAPLTTHDQLRSVLASPLLLPETRLNVTQRDLVDHTLLASGVDSDTGADIDMLLLPLVLTDYVDRPRSGTAAIEVRVLCDIADEETELLDEELLELLAQA
jgi:hypothetical protein